MDRTEALALLRETHTFPGHYRFRVVVRAGAEASVISAVTAATTDALDDVEQQPSRNGTYTSVRLSVRVEAPEQILDVYETVRSVEGVVTTL